MSFLSQCIFYLIATVINIISGNVVSDYVVNVGGFILIGVALAMSAVGFVAFSKVEERKRRYLDIPLIYISIVLDILVTMLAPKLEIVAATFGLVPAVCCLVREIKWVVDVVKKRRKPQKKNAIVLIAYILIEACLFSLNFVDFEALINKPTAEEIQLVNSCYTYTERYLTALPTDKTKLQEIDDITEKITKNGVFKKAYGKSDYFIKGDYNLLHKLTVVKDADRKEAYADVVALRLKTLIALKDYEEYTEFFVENCGYLYTYDNSMYLYCWADDSYKLTEEDFETIISGYEKALALCDNDMDRLYILISISDFYFNYKPNSEEAEKYNEMYREAYDAAAFEGLFSDSSKTQGLTSKKLAVE